MHINHAHKACNFCVKKDGDTLFDATIGSFGDAEVCLLAGLYLLNKVSKALGSINAVLYRDDGLCINTRCKCSKTRQAEKRYSYITQEQRISITIEINQSEIELLHVSRTY